VRRSDAGAGVRVPSIGELGAAAFGQLGNELANGEQPGRKNCGD
jgi:hypothetical protein